MKYLYTLAIMFSLLSLASCKRDHQYRYFDYEDVKISCPFGYIKIAARGSWKEISKIPELTQRGSPYKFSLSYYSERPAGEPIVLILSRFQVGSALEVPMVHTPLQQTSTSVDSSYAKSAAYFRLEDLSLPHEPINVEGSVSVGGTVIPFTATLVPKAWSEYRNNLLDALSGI